MAVAVAVLIPLALVEQVELAVRLVLLVVVVAVLQVAIVVLVAQVALVIVAFLVGNHYVRHQSTGIRRIASRC